MAKTRKFVKVGKRAFGFADPWSGFNISRGQVKELETVEHRRSNKIKAALRGGHLESATEEEYKAYQAKLEGKPGAPQSTEPTLKEELEDKTKAQLVKYYSDTYEVSDEDIDSFKTLNKGDMIEELLELAEEA